VYTSKPSNWTWYFLIGLAVCFLGGAALVANFTTGGLPVAVIWTFVAAILGGISGVALWKQKGTNDLLATGVRSTATVIGMENSGMIINGVPRFVVAVRVDRPGAPFEAKIGALTYSPPAIGSVLDVCYDAKNIKRIVFAETDPAASNGASTANGTSRSRASVTQTITLSSRGSGVTVQLLEQLEKMHRSGALSDDEFTKAKQKILGDS